MINSTSLRNRDRSGRLSALSGVILLFGVLTGIALSAGAAWADLEAVFYGFDNFNGEPFTGLHCPVIITEHETGTISATYANSTDRPIQPLIRADISSPTLPRSERRELPIPSGETGQIQWTVSADDKDLGVFILLKVFSYRAYQQPFREATCGILVLDIPYLTGNQALGLAFTASLVCMVGGLAGWEKLHQPLKGRNLFTSYALRTLVLFVLLGLLSSLSGWWMVTFIILALALLLLAVMVFFSLYQ